MKEPVLLFRVSRSRNNKVILGLYILLREAKGNVVVYPGKIARVTAKMGYDSPFKYVRPAARLLGNLEKLELIEPFNFTRARTSRIWVISFNSPLMAMARSMTAEEFVEKLNELIKEGGGHA